MNGVVPPALPSSGLTACVSAAAAYNRTGRRRLQTLVSWIALSSRWPSRRPQNGSESSCHDSLKARLSDPEFAVMCSLLVGAVWLLAVNAAAFTEDLLRDVHRQLWNSVDRTRTVLRLGVSLHE